MATIRNRRKPISCEPCRIRKIKCPRDGPPCGTCLRRGVSSRQCVYAQQQLLARQTPETGANTLASSSSGPSSPPGHESPSLAKRVEKLEQLLHAQWSPATPTSLPTRERSTSSWSASAPAPVSPKTVSGLDNTAKTNLHGTLSTLNTGHVRFIPNAASGHSSFNLRTKVSIEKAITGGGGPYPLGPDDPTRLSELIQLLPPSELCSKLKDVYFTSFAPVSRVT